MQLKTKKLLIGVSSSLIFITLSTVGVLYYILNKSVPDYSTNFPTQGITQPVKMYYDDYGAVHIIAQSEEDLFFAQGYAHARDRLWQMDLQRHAAQGRLSEIFGAPTLSYDKHMRTIGLKRIADSIWASPILSPTSRKVLESYSKGVNAFLAQVQNGEHNLTLEFDALKYQPEPWKPEDCLSIIRLMGWEMNTAWNIDVALAEITQKLGYEKASALYPEYHDKSQTIIKTSQLSKNQKRLLSQTSFNSLQKQPQQTIDIKPLVAFHDADRQYRKWSSTLGSHIGSNSWVVSPKKSATGGALLANDPHLGFLTPSRWHEMQLYCKAAGIDVSGGSLPGVPTIVIGKNAHIAWGLTNVMIDDCDFFLTSDTLEQGYEIIEEIIDVKDGNPEPFLVSKSKFGIVLPSPMIHERIHNNTARLDSFDIAMQWTGQWLSDETLAFVKLNKAQNWHEFRDALKDFTIPGQNFVYADREGNIGLQPTGRVPIRLDKQGLTLRHAATPAEHWQGFIPFQKLPYLYNPPEGVIITANNKLIDEAYPYYISSLWEPDSRAARIKEVLDAKPTVDLKDLQTLQYDMISIQSRRLLPYLLNALAGDSVGIHQQPIEYLKNWDCNFDKASIGATIFTQFYMRLLYNTYADELGDHLFMSYMELINAPSRVMQQMIEDSCYVEVITSDSTSEMRLQTNPWFNNTNTAVEESRDDILRLSFAEAITTLRNHLGTDEKLWRWESVHTLAIKHVFGQAGDPENEGFITKLFNFEPVKTGGNATSVNNGEFRYKHVDFSKQELVNASQQVGASSRRVIDMSDTEKFYSIMPGGNSCDIMSPHYSDQLEKWAGGELREFVTNPNQFEVLGYDCTTLEIGDK